MLVWWQRSTGILNSRSQDYSGRKQVFCYINKFTVISTQQLSLLEPCMYTDILINATPYENRIALVDSGNLLEFYLERPAEKGLVGNIYCGKVVRVLPGMQAAFVDIGLERAGFLYVDDDDIS